MSPRIAAIVVVSVFLLGWYGVAHAYNRRRGWRLQGWLDARLDALGGEKEAVWIGSPASGALFNIRRASPPFRRLEVTLLLANREIPVLWLLDYLRGKCDRTIIRGTLRSPRRGEVWVGSTRPADCQGETWTRHEGPHGLTIVHRGRGGSRLVTAITPWLEGYGAHLSWFHWRKQDPHINLQLRIAGLLKTEAEAFLTDLSTALQADSQE